MDVDEEAFRQGELRARLYGYLRVPLNEGIAAPERRRVRNLERGEQKEVIAEYVVDSMESGTIYVLGPGTTTRAVADKMGQTKTLLGVDVYLDGKAIMLDAPEEDLLRILNGTNRQSWWSRP